MNAGDEIPRPDEEIRRQRDISDQIQDVINETVKGEHPEFHGIVTGYIAVVTLMTNKGEHVPVLLSSPNTPYWSDLGLLTEAVSWHHNPELMPLPPWLIEELESEDD